MKRLAPICLTLLVFASIAPAAAMVPAGFDQVVIFVTNSLQLKKLSDTGGMVQVDGDVVANQAPTSATLGSSQVMIEKNVQIDGDVYGDSVDIKKDASVAGTVFANSLSNSGTIGGTGVYAPPVFNPPPPFKTGIAGAADVTVAAGGSLQLAPGAYRDLVVGAGGELNLDGGFYNVRSVSLADDASLTYDQLTEVTATGDLATGKRVSIAPVAPAVASDLAIYVAGTDGASNAADIGQENVVKGSIWAANGTMRIEKESQISGAALARDMQVEKDVTFVLATFFFNRAPFAADDAYTTDEDTALNVAAPGVLGNDTDFDGDPLNAVLVSGVSNGTLTLNADGSFDYTPDGDFNGSDSFTYQATDGSAGSNVATVTITINPVNDAPTAADDAYTTDEDTVLNVAAPGVLGNDADVDGDALSAVLVADVANGSLTLNADGSFDYTPDLNFNGSDSFTYKANDGAADSNDATVTITINPVDDAPTGVDDAYAVDEGGLLEVPAPGVLANDFDPEGGALIATPVPVSGPSHGILALAADGSFSYAHDGSETESDGFVYEVCSAAAPSECSQATVAITINPVNDQPILGDDSGTVAEGGTLTEPAPGVLANDSDPEGGALTVSLAPAAPPAHGSVTLAADGSYSYTHDGGETTVDGFSYEACDVGGACSTAQVSLTITPVNDAPTANPQDFGTAVTAITLTGSDPEGDDLLFELVSGPSAGTLAGLPATEVGGAGVGVTYSPDSSGDPDSFIFRVTDSGSLTGTAEVRIAAGSVGDDDGVEPPELAVIDAKDGFVEVNEDANVNIVLVAAAPLTGANAVGDLTFTVTSSPANGTFSGLADDAAAPVRSAGVLYQPAAGYTGSDSIGFQACEVADPLNCDSATVSIDVVAFAAQEAPVAEDRFFSTGVDDPLTFDLTSSESGSGAPGGDPRTNSASAGAGTSAVTFQTGNEPNLAVSGFSAPACVRVDDSIGSQIQVTVTNNGAVEVPAGQSVSIGFYVSVDPIITTADTLLSGGRENISSIEPDGLQVGESISNFLFSGASVPSSSPLGNLYIGVLADEFDSVTELSEVDNRASRAIIIETAGGNCTNPTVLQTLYRLTSLPAGGVLTQERFLPFPQSGTEQVPVQVGEVLNSVSGSPTTILFTPDQGFSGVASFGYTVETQGLTSAPATAEIRVVDPNATTACTTCETLTIAVEGAANGDVTADPTPDAGGGICSTGAVCDLEYPPGIAVILQARPTDASGTFAGWSGCSSSNNPRITVVTGVATSCTATFDSTP